MTARCLLTSVSAIGEGPLRNHVAEHLHQEDIGLTFGAEYRIHGLIFRSGIAWLYLCDEADAEYPKPYCFAFFELTDPSVPKDWVLVPENPALLVPRAWAQIPNFLEKLVDGDLEAVSVFSEMRRT